MDIVTDIAIHNGAIVEYICVPYSEYESKKTGMDTLRTQKKTGFRSMDNETYKALARARISVLATMILGDTGNFLCFICERHQMGIQRDFIT